MYIGKQPKYLTTIAFTSDLRINLHIYYGKNIQILANFMDYYIIQIHRMAYEITVSHFTKIVAGAK